MTLSGAVQNPRRFLALTGPTMEEMWLFILIDMKTYPMQPTQAQRFGIQPSQAKPWMHLLSPLVREALADCGELPARKNRGKQKKHTIKNDLLIDEPCKIHFLSDTVAGKKNDKRLADESGYRLPNTTLSVLIPGGILH